MASTSPCHTIKTIWSQIETYLPLQSTVAVSQTCRELHREIVDADTQKIKVSHFGDQCEPGHQGPWERIPHFIPSALNAIHFPSLRKIDLAFKGIKSRNNNLVIEDGMTSCFPILVANLSCARNLEWLKLDVGTVLDVDNALRIEPLIELFGRNLTQCKKLKRLIISVAAQKYCVDLMRDLVCALTPVIERQRKVLSTFTFFVMGRPEDVSADQINPLRTLDFVAIDFFAAIFSCSDLATLVISCERSYTFTNALMGAMKRLKSGQAPVWSNLQHLTLGLYDPRPPSPPLLEYGEQLIEVFSGCQNIEEVGLNLPSDMWTNNLKAVRKMLCDKPRLSCLYLCFRDYDDSDENILQLLEDCILNKEKKSYKKSEWQFTYLDKVNGSRLFKLIQQIKDEGGCFNGMHGSKPREDDTGEETFTFNRGDEVKEGDLPQAIYVDHWWMSQDIV